MSNKTKINLDSVDITIDHKENTVCLFDWGAMEQVMFYASDWSEIKSAIDSQLRRSNRNQQDPKQTTEHFVAKADRLFFVDPITANKRVVTSYGVVPVCQECGKIFAAYEKDDKGFVCRSCKLPKP